MKFTATVAALLCANAAVAAPGTALRRERAAKRAAQRSSRPMMLAEDAERESITNGNETAHVQYSSNWAGAVLIGNGYTSVTGTIVVPAPKAGTSGSESAASAWVGIDGDTCSSSILQTGIDFTYENGRVSYDAWYEWFPDYAYNFDGISIKTGDTITMTVTASSKTGGTAVIHNQSNGQSVTHTFNGQGAPLCETNAEWIVEDFESGGDLVPFANFGTVTFTGASAKSGGRTVGVNGAQILDIQQGRKVLTNCGTSGSSSVTCKYTA